MEETFPPTESNSVFHDVSFVFRALRVGVIEDAIKEEEEAEFDLDEKVNGGEFYVAVKEVHGKVFSAVLLLLGSGSVLQEGKYLY